ncbi:MAG: hypothetical protein AAGA56_26795, partial [Myxococcota bacterium]
MPHRTPPTTVSSVSAPPTGLHRHRSRPAWGFGLAVDQRDDVVLWQFEDGKLRRIAHSFGHLLEPVDLAADDDARLVAELSARAGLTVARRRREAEDGAPLLTFDEQVSRFSVRFPEGFAGKKWAKAHRGVDAKRRLKRHRDAAMAQAQELLSEEALTAAIDEGRPEAVLQAIAQVLDATDLTPKRATRLLDEVRSEDVALLASAWVALLHGDGALEDRMLGVLTPLRRAGKPTWTLVTTPLALVHPERYPAVSLKAFREQAKWLAPNLTLHHQPDGAQYERLRQMAVRLRGELVSRDLTPADMLDVVDFIAVSLKPLKPAEIEAAAAREAAPASGPRL